jgi:hypothetical protein
MIQNAIRFADQIQSEFSIWAHIPGCFRVCGGGGQMVSLEVGRFAKYIQHMGVRIESYQVGGGVEKESPDKTRGSKNRAGTARFLRPSSRGLARCSSSKDERT